MRAPIGRIAFLISLATVWVVLVVSTLTATAAFYQATRRQTANSAPAWQTAPCAQADGGIALSHRAD
jgi:hypothetical protein